MSFNRRRCLPQIADAFGFRASERSREIEDKRRKEKVMERSESVVKVVVQWSRFIYLHTCVKRDRTRHSIL